MKVLIASDSHGLTKELQQLKEKHRHDIDLFIHCGDSELVADHPAMKDFVTVRGNCDYEERYPEDTVKTIGDQTIFITHGHRYSVKSNLLRLAYRANELSADIVCFGHSHLLGAEMVHGTLFINPGSMRLPRGRAERTYVILEILTNTYQLKVYDVDGGDIPELTQIFSLSNG